MAENVIESTVKEFVKAETEFCLLFKKLVDFEDDLGCVDGKIVGTGRPDYTQDATEYRLTVKDNEFLLVDIPGIEGNEKTYTQIIKESLLKAHLIFYVNGSGKKIEKDTLEKIKEYMRDKTSVYAIFNVHCNAKKHRVHGIDRTYCEELEDAYNNQKEIAIQTEKELKSFLGENFKSSVILNGLLAFSANTFDCGVGSTIVNDSDKNLKSAQTKFFKEYSNDIDRMQKDSNIADVKEIILKKIENFDTDIMYENLKKLKNRLNEMISDFHELKEKENCKIKRFFRDYNSFQNSCERAKDDFVISIKHIGRGEVEMAFGRIEDVLFDVIEKKGGKLKSDEIEEILNRHKDGVSKQINDGVTNKINEAISEYREAINEAEERLYNDFQHEQKKFQLEMQSDEMLLNTTFIKELKFTFVDFRKGILKLGGYALSGIAVGSVFPGVGNVVGGVVGVIVGICEWVWSWLASKEKRINKAKERLKEMLDKQIDDVTEKVKQEIQKMKLENEIKEHYKMIIKNIENQRTALNIVNQVLDTVEENLNSCLQKVNE